MKSLITISTLLLFAFTSTGQLTKKTWLAGGSGSFNSYKQEYTVPPPSVSFTYDYKVFDVSATIGYFIIDKLAIGAKPAFSYYKGVNEYQSVNAAPTKLIIGPFVRYYLLNAEKTYNFFVETSYQTGLNNFPLARKDKGKYNILAIMAGTEIFFNSSVGLEILLGYKATKETIDKSSAPYTDIRKGFQVALGFQIHLEKN